MREIKSIEIRTPKGDASDPAVGQRLKALILAREGTLPGSRGFGLPYNFLDLRSQEAINLLMLELSDKAEIYLPEIEISDIEAVDDKAGSVSARIYIEDSEEEEEESDD